MTCRQPGCGDNNDYTYWCWDCSTVIDMKNLAFDNSNNEPAGSCLNCRKKSREKRNNCKTVNYKE